MTQPIKQRVEVENAASGELKDITRDADRLKQATEGQQRAADQATQADRERSRALDGLRARLSELQRRELELEDAVRSGSVSEEDAAQVTRSRQRQIDRLSRAIAQQEDRQTELNQRTRESVDRHREAADSQDDLADSSDKTTGALGRMGAALARKLSLLAAAAVAIRVLLAVYRQWIENIDIVNQKLKENADLVQSNAEARLNFVALQGVESAEDVQRIDSLAGFAGRDPAEFARVLGLLKSQFANASDDDINSLAVEVAAASQLTDAPAQDLAKGLAAIFRQSGDAQASGNIFQQAIQEAGEADPARLGVEIGKLIGIAQQFGGLDTGQAAGFASAGTALGLPNEIATTGLRNVFLSLRGRGTPEGNELLNSLGVSRDDVILALQQIAEARQSGQLDDAGLESIGGREATPIFAALSDPAILGDFLASVGRVDAAEDFEGRIATDKAEGIFDPGSIQALNLLIKQLESQTESTVAGDTEAARIRAARQGLELRLQQLRLKPLDQISTPEGVQVPAERAADVLSVSEADIERILEEFDAQVAQGTPIEEALSIALEEDDDLLRGPRIPGVVPFVGGERINLPGFGTRQLDARRSIRQQEVADPVLELLEQGPQTDPTVIIENQTVINGTQINNASDPATGDRELQTEGRGR